MEEISDFSKSKKHFERYTVDAGTVSGRIVRSVVTKTLTLRDNDETSYSNKCVQENQSELLQSSSDKCEANEKDCISDDIYDRYNFHTRIVANSNLPIMSHERDILDAIEINPAVVLYGATGSGKTTQVPQFILDDACLKRKYCSIVVAQPQRLAASSNAKRVADERGWKTNTIIGCQIGLDECANHSKDTRILYCTTGILLERLIHAKNFDHFTHIIIDDVHERSKDVDFLLIVIKKLLTEHKTNSNVKFVLMSATQDATAFAKYFELPNGNKLVPAPIIRIEQKHKYKISEFFFDDLVALSPKSENINFWIDEPGIDDALYSMVVNLINQIENIDANDQSMGCSDGMGQPAVLIFLPGINEINRMHSTLMDQWSPSNSARTLLCVVLHSMSDDHQQDLAMRATDRNTRKIILATNIAESSITVPDVKHVIDFCLVRILVTNRRTNFTSLQLNWTGRNNCMQRMGRAGCVMDGRCYRLVTKYFYENLMLETLPPELIRSPLENIVLMAKKLDFGSPESVLAMAMDKPKLSDIAKTILVLKEAGALLRNCGGVYSELDGDLTFMGRIMADLPIDIKISRFILFGYCFGAVEVCLIIGAALSCSKTIFKSNYSHASRMRSYSLLLQWANGTGSDLSAMYNAYKVWCHQHTIDDFGTTDTKMNRDQMHRSEAEWADKYCIDLAAMYECKEQIDEMRMRLKCLGIGEEDDVSRVHWNAKDMPIILKTIISGAFYPNIFVTNIPSNENPRNAFRELDGHDPRNTIYFKGFPRNNIRCLYTKAIKNIFVENGCVDAVHVDGMQVLFDDETEKVYVTFKSTITDVNRGKYGVERMPGNTEIEVYKAVKMRKFRMQNNLRVMKSTEQEIMYANNCGLNIDDSNNQIPNVRHLGRICVPRILKKSVIGYVTHIRSCDRFWFQPIAQFKECESFKKSLDAYSIRQFSDDDEVFVGQVVLVNILRNKRTAEYCRAKVLHINPSWRVLRAYRLFLIDVGRTDQFHFHDLRNPKSIESDFMELPPRCFECSLAKLQPSPIHCPSGAWPTEAVNCFQNFVNNTKIRAEIYSVANGVVHVFIHPLVLHVNLNDILRKRGFAALTEENFASQMDHNHRIEEQNISVERENCVESPYIKYLRNHFSVEVMAPSREICAKEIRLQGPFSPLETSVSAVTEACRSHSIKIDLNSVNSVLLDNDLQQQSEKYIVAASVCDTAIKRELTIRGTTLMPNIRAFGPLMALIFCPTMELKRNKAHTKYVAIRTGLGYDLRSERPIFEEHDVVFNLDTDITLEDIRDINRIRYCLNTLLHTFPKPELAVNFSAKQKAKLTVKIKELVVNLLEKSRNPIEVETEPFAWNSYDSVDIVSSQMDEIYRDRAIFPLHRALKIYTEDERHANDMRTHCADLERMAHSNHVNATGENRKILCKLCVHRMETLSQLKTHLRAQGHCYKYEQISHK